MSARKLAVLGTLAALAMLAPWSAALHAQTKTPQTKPTPGNAETGRSFALLACTGCHIVSSDQSFKPVYTGSPHPPDFKDIANRPNVSAEMIRKHLESLHIPPKDGMPDLMLTGDQEADVIAFILSLRDKPGTSK